MSEVTFSNVMDFSELVDANAARRAWADEIEAKEREEEKARLQKQKAFDKRCRQFEQIDSYLFWQKCARAGGIAMMMTLATYAVMGRWGYTAGCGLLVAFFYWFHHRCSKRIVQLRKAVQSWPM